MDMQVFNSPEGQEIRIVPGDDGQPLWVAKDVLSALGYTWGGDRISHVPEEWRGMRSVRTPSGTQEMAVLSEQGLYFFLGRSDKPAALPFQKWIAGKVLPEIRRTGSYHGSQDIVERLVGLEDPRLLDLAAEGLRNIAKGKRMLARAFGGNVDSEAEHVDTAAESALRAWVVTAPEKTTTEEALAAAGLPNTRTNQMLAGRILHGNGYQRRRLWGGGDRVYAYVKEG